MTGRDDFDLLLGRWLEAQARRREPDGLSERILARTAVTRRRPAWLILDRWLDPLPRAQLASVRRMAIVILVVLGVAVALGATILTAGSYRRLPPPFGLARPGLVAFDATDAATSTNRIYVTDVKGASRQAVTPVGLQARAARFSPNGTTIAFWARSTPEGPWSLMTVAADGSDVRTIAGNWAAVGTIAWAPDSRHLAFDATVGFVSRIFVARADASGAAPIGDAALSASDPVWSPDGTRIAFRGDRIGQGFSQLGVYAMAADGSAVVRLSHVTAVSDYDFVAPVWSPDGTRVAVTVADGASFNVWVLAADGTSESEIASTSADEMSPRWAPDGSRIAYLRGPLSGVGNLAAHHQPGLRNAGLNVIVADPNGSDTAVLPGPLVDFHDLVWAPDGAHLLAYLPSVDGTFDGTDDRIVVFSLAGDAASTIDLGGAASDTGDWQRLAP